MELWLGSASMQAIVQYGGLDDNDLLYFSYTNQVHHVSPQCSWSPVDPLNRICSML